LLRRVSRDKRHAPPKAWPRRDVLGDHPTSHDG
jgi:hypothetical protein